MKHDRKVLDEEYEKIEDRIEKAIQFETKRKEDVDKKLKNNDYDECNKINHDKMVLENRKMILENKILLLELYKDSGINKDAKEKMLKLLKPKK